MAPNRRLDPSTRQDRIILIQGVSAQGGEREALAILTRYIGSYISAPSPKFKLLPRT